MQEFTVGQACQELRCSRKTLMEWLSDEGIVELPRGEVDKRNRVLSQALLATLSQKHRRPLTSDLKDQVEGIEVFGDLLKEVKSLRAEVAELRRQEQARERQVQQTIQQAITTLHQTFQEQLDLIPSLQMQLNGITEALQKLQSSTDTHFP